MEWLKKVPTPITVTVISATVILLLAVLGGFVALTFADKPTDDYWVFVNRVANLLTFPLTALAAGGAVSAAKSAGQAAEQTNGHLADKDAEIASLRAHLATALRRPADPGGPNG